MKKSNIPEDQLEIIRYRNMLFRLYHAFSDYRDMIIEKNRETGSFLLLKIRKEFISANWIC